MNKISKGEQKVIDILTQNKISFKREVSFADLKGKRNSYLRFDFAVFKNGRLYCLIEFDGQQHFQYTPYFHKKIGDFKRQQEWDRRKNSYCLEHGVMLIRIPYWDIDNLTLSSIFTTPQYRVTSRFHNDNLNWGNNI